MSGPYAPPPNMQGYAPPPNPQGYAPPPNTQGYAPPPNTQGYVPPQNSQGYAPPPGNFKQPEPGFAPQYPQYNQPGAVPPPNLHMPITENVGGNDDQVKGFQFSDETIRRGFIRKVYAILSLQLLCSMGFVLLFTFHEPTKLFAINNMFVFFLAIILVLVTVISLSCCEGVRRTSPHNIIMLSLFTLGESYLVGCCVLQFDPEVVIMALGVTTVVVVSLTIFAIQTKWDFTMFGGLLFTGLILLTVFGLILCFTRSDVASLIYSIIGAFLFSIYLIYDTQLIMGNHKYSLTPEEYIMGALLLYLDIINLFLHILKILAAAKK